MTTKKKSVRNVMVTTEHKGVFAGEFKEKTGKTIVLRNARMCVYWDSKLHGVLGLATIGPGNGCRISPSVNVLELEGVTSVVDMTDAAVKNWKEEPWN